MSLKLIFGFPVNERFIYSKQLYYSIKKFCYDPEVIFASNKQIGYSCGRLKKITSRREYRLRQIHGFVFDAFEEIADWDFDYFVKLDSDCLFANYGFEKFFAERFDFLDSVDENENKLHWYWAQQFMLNADSYRRLIEDLGLTRKDTVISGCLSALQIYSKDAVKFIAGNIKAIENSLGYMEMKRKQDDLCLSELLIPNLLKDAGFKYRSIYRDRKWEPSSLYVRWRPYVCKKEVAYIDSACLPILYHPIKRKIFNRARAIIMKKIGYSYSFKDIACELLLGPG